MDAIMVQEIQAWALTLKQKQFKSHFNSLFHVHPSKFGKVFIHVLICSSPGSICLKALGWGAGAISHHSKAPRNTLFEKKGFHCKADCQNLTKTYFSISVQWLFNRLYIALCKNRV